jgi:hypothetical protein
MTDKEKKEIELILGCVFLHIKDGLLDRAWDVYDEFEKQFKHFIDSLQEESVSDDLEEAADSYIKTYGEILGFGRQTFKAGAKWQKEQMMTKAIDGKVIANGMGNPILHLWDKGRHLIDKKVKVIVIKEN